MNQAPEHGAGLPVRGVLLTNGENLGTLAAARDLGRLGVPVVLADANPNAITARSRFVSRRVEPPPLERPRDWVRWMVEFGRREPGHVLLATSDDVCWLLDAHRAELEPWFRLYQPPGGGMWQLVNKRRLHEHAAAVGIDQPEQWPAGQALERATQLPYPVIVKPCTQAGMRKLAKGLVAHDPATLLAAIESLRDRHGWSDEMLEHDSTVGDMVVQAFHPAAERDIYSMSGFYSPEADTFALRASQKVLQQPMRVGIGLCFEGRPVDPQLAARLRALFDRVGYRGAFEVEYLRADGRHLLIDVNTRFYGQMAFDIARGLPIPRLCWFAALGRWDEVKRLAMVGRVTAMEPDRSCDAWLLRVFTMTHLLGGNFSLGEWRYWRDWSRGEQAADFVDSGDDPGPAAQLRRQVGHDLVRHPRSTLRRFFVR